MAEQSLVRGGEAHLCRRTADPCLPLRWRGETATSWRWSGGGTSTSASSGLRRLHLAFTANRSRFRTATASRKADLNVPKLTVASDKIGDYRANCVWAGADRTSGK